MKYIIDVTVNLPNNEQRMDFIEADATLVAAGIKKILERFPQTTSLVMTLVPKPEEPLLQLKELIFHLEMGVQKRYPHRNDDPDILAANKTMREAAIVLRAIFDPENQPSQWGTRLEKE